MCKYCELKFYTLGKLVDTLACYFIFVAQFTTEAKYALKYNWVISLNQLNYCIIIGWLSIRWRRNSRQWIWIKQYQTVIYAKSCSHGFYQLLELKVFCVHYQSSFFNCHFYSLYYIQTAIWRWLSLLLFFPYSSLLFCFFMSSRYASSKHFLMTLDLFRYHQKWTFSWLQCTYEREEIFPYTHNLFMLMLMAKSREQRCLIVIVDGTTLTIFLLSFRGNAI